MGYQWTWCEQRRHCIFLIWFRLSHSWGIPWEKKVAAPVDGTWRADLHPGCSLDQLPHHLKQNLPQFSSVTQSCPTLCDPMDCNTCLPCPSPTPRAYSNSCPLSWWCHPTISSSVIAFSSCLQSFPTSGSFPMSQFFTTGDQSIGASASASVLPMKTQGWCPSEWTGWISLQSKGLSRVFSNTTVQKHQFFGAQFSLWSNSHIHTWLLEKL